MTILIILLNIVIGIAGIFFIVNTIGLLLRYGGQKPFDEVAVVQDEGTYVINNLGRHIEYFTYGTDKADAPVVINLHGSGLEGKGEMELHGPICDALGVRGISISLPGCGYTDMKPGRRVIDWVEEDLIPLLNKEKVGSFMITGHSQGTAHAMAAAYSLPERCIGLGLNAPVFPRDVSKEEEIKGALGLDSLPSTRDLSKWYYGWFFTFLNLMLKSPNITMQILLKGFPTFANDKPARQRFYNSVKRGVIRGAVGGIWESAGDVCYDWGFDPRSIRIKNFCIWHAEDDNAAPPEIGSWLAEYYQEKEGVLMNFRKDNQQAGHMTFSRGSL